MPTHFLQLSLYQLREGIKPDVHQWVNAHMAVYSAIKKNETETTGNRCV